MMNRIREIGYIEKGTGKHQSNVVYLPIGICPCICHSVGYKQPPPIYVDG